MAYISRVQYSNGRVLDGIDLIDQVFFRHCSMTRHINVVAIFHIPFESVSVFWDSWDTQRLISSDRYETEREIVLDQRQVALLEG